MEKVNINCNNLSVERKTTIAVLMDLPLNSEKLQCEVNNRLYKKANDEDLPINPDWLRKSCEVRSDPDYTDKFFVTYPPSLSNIEEIILEILGEIESDVEKAVETKRLLGLLEE